MSKNSGRIYEVTGGVHKEKTALALHRDQRPEFVKLKKVCVYISDTIYQGNLFAAVPDLKGGEKSILISAEFLKHIGFID